MNGPQLDKKDRRLWQNILRTVRPFPLSAPETKLLVGISGGADSLTLLHVLWRQLGPERLVGAHLHHGLRSSADDDAQFVAETAKSWRIPLVQKKENIGKLARLTGLSLEAAGRQRRYLFFAEQAAKWQVTAVAVGHNADDQAETVLLHLLRGSGGAGLAGMLPVSNLPGQPTLPLLRPLLQVTRAEIEAYCVKNGLEPRHDTSNDEVHFTRNRIRHELLPQLRKYNPQISAQLQQLAIITADEQAVLKKDFEAAFPLVVIKQGQRGLVLDRGRFVEWPAAWQRLALREVVKFFQPSAEIGFKTIEQARWLILANKSGSEATLPGDLKLCVEASEIVIGEPGPTQDQAVPQMATATPLTLAVPGKMSLAGGWSLEAVLRPDMTRETARHNRDPWQVFVDVGVNDSLWVRPPQPGERFQPLGLNGRSQAVKDLLSNRKVVRDKRTLWPVVATRDYPVWIVGLHLDERASLKEKSQQIVQIICQVSK